MNDKNATRYEKTRVISSRALQISQGSPILVKVPKGMTKTTEIAELEWKAGVIPITIKQESEKDK